jgi:hypothetical protein
MASSKLVEREISIDSQLVELAQYVSKAASSPESNPDWRVESSQANA